jgi:hypothetical protein
VPSGHLNTSGIKETTVLLVSESENTSASWRPPEKPVVRDLIEDDIVESVLITSGIAGLNKGTLVVTFRPSENTVLGITKMVFEDLSHLFEGDL